MEFKLWGSRGSLPSPLTAQHAKPWLLDFLKVAKEQGVETIDQLGNFIQQEQYSSPLCFGGNTPCTEVSVGGSRYFVDMGSGLREAGTTYLGESKEFNIFITHMHWDHLIGLPFFVPVFTPGHKINIYHVHKNTPEYIKILFNGVNFPIKWSALGADIHFHHMPLYSKLKFPDLTVSCFALDHPGGCFGYRFEAHGKSVTIGVDGEYKRVNEKDLGPDLPYFQNLSALVFDAQYEPQELLNKFDWGHCSADIGIDLAAREGIRNLVLIHHDPWAQDAKLRKSIKRSQRYAAMAYKRYPEVWERLCQKGPNVYAGYDGFSLDLNSDSLKTPEGQS